MWQEHGMRFEDFFQLEPSDQAMYIASELYCREKQLEQMQS
nr:MAG TPA: hypothetical protein [Caudoviricetes sp.]